IRFGDASPWMRIVGIVAHAKSTALVSDNTEGFYYLSVAQSPPNTAEIVVRSTRMEGLSDALRTAIRRVDPTQPLYDIKTMDQRIDASLISRRFLVVLLSIFAGLALLLAALGLYGVISYTVRLRQRELGVRMALGADRMAVVKLVVGKGLRLAVMGMSLGV